MPIIVKDAEFSQSQDYVFARLPLHNHSLEEVDVTIFESYVKVSYPPHFFEAFLSKNVVDTSSSVRFEDKSIVLTLKKEEPDVIWDKLAVEITDKQEMRRLRDAAMKRLAEVTEQRRQTFVQEKAEKGRENVRAQMKIEQIERERIEKQREMEKRLALATVVELRKDAGSDDRDSPPPPLSSENGSKKEPNSKLRQIEAPPSKSSPSVKVEEVKEEKRIVDKAIFTSKPEPKVEPQKALPAVRNSGQIAIRFTPRVFPTPSRESQAQEEEAWLKKQAEARKIVELDEKELTESDRDPELMKKKAAEFYKQGNFLAAANAYTHVMRMQPSQPALYSNRAACHLRVGNLMKCVEDSSRALELFVPAVEANARERLLAHIRRGTALAKLELVVEGLADYQAALKLLPPDDPLRPGIERDAEALRQHIQSSST